MAPCYPTYSTAKSWSREDDLCIHPCCPPPMISLSILCAEQIVLGPPSTAPDSLFCRSPGPMVVQRSIAHGRTDRTRSSSSTGSRDDYARERLEMFSTTEEGFSVLVSKIDPVLTVSAKASVSPQVRVWGFFCHTFPGSILPCFCAGRSPAPGIFSFQPASQPCAYA